MRAAALSRSGIVIALDALSIASRGSTVVQSQRLRSHYVDLGGPERA
jgi:hypothetical protein